MVLKCVSLLLGIAAVYGVNGTFVSVNAVDLMWNYAGTSGNNASHSRTMLADACSRGFNFIRFAASAYWPIEMQRVHYNQPAVWWNLFDQLVGDAAERNCTLMPTFLWNPYVFSDIAKEPLSALLVNGSTSRELLFTFVGSVVARYKTNSTIAAWELWNELSNQIDHSQEGVTNFCDPPLGTPAARTSRDNMSTSDLMALQRDLAAHVRSIDTAMRRPISSGNDIPGTCAEHIRASYHAARPDWTPDTPEQFAKNIADVNAHVDWASIHLYKGEGVRWNITDPLSAAVLAVAGAASRAAGKELYLGEFGDPLPGERPLSRNVLAALRGNVTRATVWVWEFVQFGAVAQYSLLPDRDAEFIQLMQHYNAAP